jgi:hypothetical protein
MHHLYIEPWYVGALDGTVACLGVLALVVWSRRPGKSGEAAFKRIAKAIGALLALLGLVYLVGSTISLATTDFGTTVVSYWGKLNSLAWEAMMGFSALLFVGGVFLVGVFDSRIIPRAWLASLVVGAVTGVVSSRLRDGVVWVAVAVAVWAMLTAGVAVWIRHEARRQEERRVATARA